VNNMAYQQISLGGYTLYITSLSPVRRQKTRKSIIGKSLVETSVLGLNAQQWEISLNGVITGTTSTDLDNNRINIESLDNGEKYDYSDGLRTGTYIIKPGTLTFNDSGEDAGGLYRYSIMLVEW
jgi:hypothetical protein